VRLATPKKDGTYSGVRNVGQDDANGHQRWTTTLHQGNVQIRDTTGKVEGTVGKMPYKVPILRDARAATE
jgi:hypothetical protein